MKIPLRVLRERPAAHRTVLTPTDDDPVVYRGTGGEHQYLCGQCGTVLMTGVHRGEVGAVVIRCGVCTALNEIDA